MPFALSLPDVYKYIPIFKKREYFSVIFLSAIPGFRSYMGAARKGMTCEPLEKGSAEIGATTFYH